METAHAVVSSARFSPQVQRPHGASPTVRNLSARDRWIKKFSMIDDVGQKWKAIGLEALQKVSLEADQLQITTNREALHQARKHLIVKTGEYKRMPKEQKEAETSTVLKLYQAHIDELFNCLKYAENAYVELGKSVRGMIDPAPLLSRLSADRTAVLEYIKDAEELEGTRQSLVHREAELSELKNQEVTIQQLREELTALQLRAASGVVAERTAAEASEELQAVLAQWQKQQNEMQQDFLQMSQECRKLQLERQQLDSQASALREKLDDVHAVHDRDVDSLLGEIQSLQVQVAEQSYAKSRLQDQLERIQDAKKEQLPDVSLVSTPISSAQQVLEAQQQLRDSNERTDKLVADYEALRRDHAATTQALDEVRQQFDEQSKSVVDVEMKYKDTCRRTEALEEDLRGSQAECNTLRARVQEQQASESNLRQTVAELQNDLRIMLREQATTADATAAAAGPSPALAKPLFNLASVIDGASKGDGAGPTTAAAAAAAAAGAGPASLDETLALQRDRYRHHLLALEETTTKEMDALKHQIHSMKSENSQLREYLHSGLLSTANGGSGQPTLDPNGNGTAPRSLFGRSSKGVLDQAGVLLARFVIANDWTRRIFVVYMLGLHTIVFLALMFSVQL